MGTTERTAEQQARETTRNYRGVVASVVGALRSAEANKSFASFSLEEAIDQAIDRIEGAQEGRLKPNRVAQVAKIREDLTNAIEGMRASDPDSFRPASETTDVNTAPEPEES